MVNYIAIIDSKDDMYAVVVIDSNSYKIIDKRVLRRHEVQGIARSCRPINFSIENGEVKETMGSFERLKSKNNVQPHIVVEELATKAGRIVGYRLLNPVNGNILSLKKEEILKRQESSDTPLLQNGIIRGNKINCYSHSNFPRFIIGTKARTAAHKVSVKETAKNESTQEAKDRFTKEQKHELSRAKNEGIDYRFMLNPELSPKQMRILWVSKKKGAYSEYFAKPEYSEEVMKFYADRLMTKEMVKECADLLNHPEFELDKLVELYLAICDGIDYTSFINDSSAEEMHVKREKLREKQWGSTYTFSGDDIKKAVAFAKSLKKSKE